MRYFGNKSVSKVVAKWLGFAWYAAWIVLPFALLGSFLLWRSSASPFRNLALPGGLRISISPEYVTSGSGPRLLWLLTLSSFISYPIHMLIIFHLRALFQNFARNRIFSQVNAKRLHIVGWALVGNWVVNSVVNAVSNKAFVSNVNLPGVEMSVNLMPNWGGLLLGLIVLVMGQAFSEATYIKEQQDLTI